MKYTIKLSQQPVKQLEVIQEVVLSEAFNLNDLRNEQEIRTFISYIVLSGRKILEKKKS